MLTVQSNISRENAELAKNLIISVAAKMAHVPDEQRFETFDRICALQQRKIVCKAIF